MTVQELIDALKKKDRTKQVFIVLGPVFAEVKSVGEFTTGDISISDTPLCKVPVF